MGRVSEGFRAAQGLVQLLQRVVRQLDLVAAMPQQPGPLVTINWMMPWVKPHSAVVKGTVDSSSGRQELSARPISRAATTSARCDMPVLCGLVGTGSTKKRM
jgi:hypothetical protein